MTTIRIYVEHDGPLDGSSPLHPEAHAAWNSSLGLQEIWVPAGVPLGRLQLGTLAPGGEHWIEHLTITSACGVHQPGSFIGLGAPMLEDISPAPPPMIPLLDLGSCEETNTGVLTEGLDVPIPPDHALVFDTRANGSKPGPHLIQITLGRVPRFFQGSLPTLRPMPAPEDVPQDLPEDEPDGEAEHGEGERDEDTKAQAPSPPETRIAVSFGGLPETAAAPQKNEEGETCEANEDPSP